MRVVTLLETVSLLAFLGSTPLACYCVFYLELDRDHVAIWNTYGFSLGMIGLYLAPLLCIHNWNAALHRATMNWIYLSCFTEVMFQIPHNVFPGPLHRNRGTLLEWPFAAYGLCDGRWKTYKVDGEFTLMPEVWLFNFNDFSLGILVLVTLYYEKFEPSERATAGLVVATLFRDATLWRETVEYMMDHHRLEYPYTVADIRFDIGPHEQHGGDFHFHEKDLIAGSPLRHHAIACLWLVNALWLVAPVLTTEWAIHRFERRPTEEEQEEIHAKED